MRYITFLLAITLVGCNSNKQQNETINNIDTVKIHAEPTQNIKTKKPTDSLPPANVFFNERFKEVTVEKMEDHKFLIQGKAQIFEASFSWVIEDGHEELKKGFQMTDAGAPEWGNFKFTIDVQKKRANSTLHLILFESSPKDGSRQYELPVVLY